MNLPFISMDKAKIKQEKICRGFGRLPRWVLHANSWWVYSMFMTSIHAYANISNIFIWIIYLLQFRDADLRRINTLA